MNGKSMKKVKSAVRDSVRKEYGRSDLGRGVRGKHLAAYKAGSNLIRLEPNIAEAFPTSKAVNAALESLLVGKAKSTRPTSRSTRRAKARG